LNELLVAVERGKGLVVLQADEYLAGVVVTPTGS
jgi:hypothetical protein